MTSRAVRTGTVALALVLAGCAGQPGMPPPVAKAPPADMVREFLDGTIAAYAEEMPPALGRWEKDELVVAIRSEAGAEGQRGALDRLLRDHLPVVERLTGRRLDYHPEGVPGAPDITFMLLPPEAMLAMPGRIRAVPGAACLGNVQRVKPGFGRYGEERPVIRRAVVAIRADVEGELLRRCVVEETTRVMGLFDHDDRSGRLTEREALFLRVLYDPRLEPGMTREQAAPVVRAILDEMVGGAGAQAVSLTLILASSGSRSA